MNILLSDKSVTAKFDDFVLTVQDSSTSRTAQLQIWQIQAISLRYSFFSSSTGFRRAGKGTKKREVYNAHGLKVEHVVERVRGAEVTTVSVNRIAIELNDWQELVKQVTRQYQELMYTAPEKVTSYQDSYLKMLNK